MTRDRAYPTQAFALPARPYRESAAPTITT